MQLKLYHYWRSSSSWRVRWALGLKNLDCELVPINLLENEQKSEDHLKRNPLGNVPVLEVRDQRTFYIADSITIIEWLEEIQSIPSLLTTDVYQRARIRQLANIVASGIQPIQNLKIMMHFSDNKEKRNEWSQYWIREGLNAYEALVKESAGKFSVGDSVTLADLCLIPQCYNAIRFDIALTEFPIIHQIWENAMETIACKASAPEVYKPQ